MKKFDRIISLLSCGALLFGQGAFAGKKEARGNVKELPVVESVKKKRKRSKGKNNLGGGEKPKLSGNPSGDPLLNWVKKHPYTSAGGAAVLSVPSVIAARKIHDAISQPFRVAILGRKGLREKFIKSLNDNISIGKKYSGGEDNKFVISNLREGEQIGMRTFISRIIELGSRGYNDLNKLIIGREEVDNIEKGPRTVFENLDYVMRETFYGYAHYFYDLDLSYDNWRIGGFDLGELPFLSKIWFGAPHVCIMLFDGNNKKDVEDMSKAFGNGSCYPKLVPKVVEEVGYGIPGCEGPKEDRYAPAKIIANASGYNMEFPFLPIPVRVDSLEGESKAVPASKPNGIVPEYLVYDPDSRKAAIPDGALEIIDAEDYDVKIRSGYVDKYAGKGKAYSDGGHGEIINIG